MGRTTWDEYFQTDQWRTNPDPCHLDTEAYWNTERILILVDDLK
jgi:hypothetical protein